MSDNPHSVFIHLRFETTDERDQFIDEHFPGRQCMASPGVYRVSGWGCFTVNFTRVVLLPYNRIAKKRGLL